MVEATVLFLVGSVGLFLGGLGIGWYLSRFLGRGFDTPIRVFVTLIVAIVWTVAVVAEIVIPAYTVSMMLHGIMGAVVGYFFSSDGLPIPNGKK